MVVPTRQGLGQELHMGLLILANPLQVTVHWVGESSVEEILMGEVLQALRVEGGLEVLESESIVEDVGCMERALAWKPIGTAYPGTYHR